MNAIIICRIVAAAALLAASPVHAGKITTESSTDGRQNLETLEFNDKGQLRVTSQGIDSMGLIVRDKRIYFFGELKGKPVVVDMLAALKKAQDKGMKRPESDPAVEEIAEIKPTGRKQTVVGIEGEVHNVTWSLAGKKRSEEVVLTRDPRLAAVIQGLGLDPGLMNQGPRKANLKEQVYAMGAFLLKSPASVVTSVDFSATPDARFALKAKPGDDAGVMIQVMFSTAFGALGTALSPPAEGKGKAAGAAAPSAAATPAGETTLHDAAWDGDEAQVKALLDKGADLNARTDEGETPLHFAAFKGRTAIAQLLLSKGAEVNAKKKDGATPLRLAVFKGEKATAQLLLAHGADVNARNSEGATALHSAAFRGELEIAELLLTKGADVNARNLEGGTALHTAAFNGRKEIAELLVANGADLKARTDDGDTPLHSAAFKGETVVAAFLIAKGADVNATKKDGDTALHLAAFKGEQEVAELLLAKGADAKAKNKEGETALQIAQKRGERGIVALLRGGPASPAAAVVAKDALGKSTSKVNVSSDDIKDCDMKKMPMAQCRALLVKK